VKESSSKWADRRVPNAAMTEAGGLKVFLMLQRRRMARLSTTHDARVMGRKRMGYSREWPGCRVPLASTAGSLKSGGGVESREGFFLKGATAC